MTQPNMEHELLSFDYQGVTLNEGRFKRQFQETVDYFLAVDNDEFLYTFRKKAGLPTPGKSLAGWYGGGATTFGQVLGAFAKMYRSTRDARIRDKALFLVGEWEKCVDASATVLDTDTYCFDKLLGGLLDLYEFMGYKRAIDYARKLTHTAAAKFKRDIKRDGLQDAALSSARMIEWYTLPENLYRAAELSGDATFSAFAKEWDYRYFWDKLIAKDPSIGPRHAYSHVNALSSAARAYKATGDATYLQAIKNAYDFIVGEHTYVTGGYGPAECLFAESSGYLGEALMAPWDALMKGRTYRNFAGETVTRDDAWGSCEVSCCAWAVFKICNYLLMYTGDARYGDWAEKLLYNGLGGQLPLGLSGKVMYYANYFLNGAVKSVEDRRLGAHGESFTWQCCTGTFPQDVAEYCNLLYYRDEEGILVAQYMPSTVSWEQAGKNVTLTNTSNYPHENDPVFRVSLEGRTTFPLRFRVPSWIAGEVTATINGEKIRLKGGPGTWGRIDGEWNDGDTITLQFPRALSFAPVDKVHPDIVALRYGPIVLVTDEMTELVGDAKHPETWIHPVSGLPLTFQTEKGHVAAYDYLTRRFVPYDGIGAMKWYYMYNRIRAS